MTIPVGRQQWDDTVARGRLMGATELERDHTLLSFGAGVIGSESLDDRDFEACAFDQVSLAGATLRHTTFDRCVFSGCDLSNVRLEGVAWSDVLFEDCRLSGIDWSDVSVRFHPRFVRCDLRYTTWSGVSLRGVVFEGCRMDQASFVRATLHGAHFDEVELSGTTFVDCDLRRVRFEACQGLTLDPGGNRFGDTEVPMEALLAWARSAGFIVR